MTQVKDRPVLSFRHFVQCSDQLMTAPSHDGQVSVATTGPKAIFFFPNSTHQCICTFITLLLYCGSFFKRRSPWDIWWPCVHWDYFCMTCFPPTVSALTQQLFACCGLVIISWVFNENSSVKWSVVHSCLFCFCFLGAAGVLVGHPFDTVKVGVCCILFDVCSLVTKNKKKCSTLLTAFI